MQLGSEQIEPVYTYETAIPWSWLGITPRSGIYLRSSILVVDSDLPGVEISEKIGRGKSKWIWWDGDLKLTGELPTESVDAVVAAATISADDTVNPPGKGARVVRRESPRLLRDKFEMALREPAREELPAWIAEIPRDPELQETDIVNYVATIRKTLPRLLRGRTTASTRVIIIDMALEAGTMRFLARGFMLGLLAAVQVQLDVPGSDVSAAVSRAAGVVGIDEGIAAGIRARSRKPCMCASGERKENDDDGDHRQCGQAIQTGEDQGA